MTKALSKELTAICMMSGVILWIEKAKAEKLEQILKAPAAPKFIEFEGQLLNTSSIEGVYSAHTMEELQRRKNGEWQCKFGEWHKRLEHCACISKEMLKDQCKRAVARYEKDGYWPLWAPSRDVILTTLGSLPEREGAV